MKANKRKTSRDASIQTAFCGLIAALSVTLMLTGGIIPVATYCVPMAAGILLIPVMLEFGKRAAWITYASTALICVFLGIDKEAALFYLFLGYYPIIKWSIDRIRIKQLRLFAKVSLYSGAIVLMYIVLGYFLNMNAILAEFQSIGMWFTLLLLLLFNVCMLLYDRLMMPLIFIYVQRIRPRIHFLIH